MRIPWPNLCALILVVAFGMLVVGHHAALGVFRGGTAHTGPCGSLEDRGSEERYGLRWPAFQALPVQTIIPVWRNGTVTPSGCNATDGIVPRTAL
jgi:hypothetical protein